MRRFDRWHPTESAALVIAAVLLAGCSVGTDAGGAKANAHGAKGNAHGAKADGPAAPDGGRPLSPAHERLYGLYFAGSRNERRPGVIDIGGAEGGLRTIESARQLASQGYPALALAYFGTPGLPRELEAIPLEYFARAARWLAKQPGVDPNRIVLMGGSRGGEAALLTAAEFPQLFHGVIGLAPSSYLYPGYPPADAAWTLRGERLPAGFDIPVQKIHGPVLVAGAGKDQVWDSGPAVKYIAQTLREAHFRYPHKELFLPNAGHGIAIATNPQVWPEILRYLDAL